MDYKVFIVFSFLFSSTFCISQEIGAGVSGMYNFQSEGYGVGARISINPSNQISIVPEFSYYLPSNKVHEFTAGVALEYKYWRMRKYHLYALVHAGFNNWMNYAESPMPDAQQSNWNIEGGLGVSTNGCWRPFLEYRYNLKFRETHLQLGLLYIFGCKPGRRKGVCPAYH